MSVTIMGFIEALHSVALSHPDGHDCDVCKASAGDWDLLVSLYAEMTLRADQETTR